MKLRTKEKRDPYRLVTLDTFRGFATLWMIFVQGGGGGYWFFQESKWNGITVADLVEAWFIFIVGTCIALSFNSLESRRVKSLNLLF